MWKHSTNLKQTLRLKRINTTPSIKVLTGGGKGGKTGQLCPRTVKKYLFLKKEVCFPRVVGGKEAEGS